MQFVKFIIENLTGNKSYLKKCSSFFTDNIFIQIFQNIRSPDDFFYSFKVRSVDVFVHLVQYNTKELKVPYILFCFLTPFLSVSGTMSGRGKSVWSH